MAAIRNAAIGALRLAGITNIAAANHFRGPRAVKSTPDDYS
jgi:hypothetical protein